MSLILTLFVKPARDHRAVFHAFAEQLARIAGRTQPAARVRSLAA